VQLRVPKHLVDEILAGRCVAFVGAGFTAPVLGTWKTFLTRLAEPIADAQLLQLVAECESALDFECAGQLVKLALGDDFEAAVAQICGTKLRSDPALTQRIQSLERIPFEAILTTNYDGALNGATPSTKVYSDVLRHSSRWWNRAEWNAKNSRERSRIIKLHGDANGQSGENPVVLAREDYRWRVHGGSDYANFLKTIMSTRTVLYLGVSFTDAYLNEIRSEVLSMIGAGTAPRAYAILNDRSPLWCDYFRQQEGIAVLPYTSAGSDHSGFEQWLDAIADQTWTGQRLRSLLGDQAIVWVDANPMNNRRGVARLRSVGIAVTQLRSAAELDPVLHGPARLLITHFGHRAPGDAAAFDALRTVGSWDEHPPVVVFASGDFGVANRQACLRRGAHEYACGWKQLFRTVEDLFGERSW
jgi:hypothetical protein